MSRWLTLFPDETLSSQQVPIGIAPWPYVGVYLLFVWAASIFTLQGTLFCLYYRGKYKAMSDYVCLYLFTSVCLFPCVCLYLFTSVFMSVPVSVFTSLPVFMSLCLSLSLYLCIYVSVPVSVFSTASPSSTTT